MKITNLPLYRDVVVICKWTGLSENLKSPWVYYRNARNLGTFLPKFSTKLFFTKLFLWSWSWMPWAFVLFVTSIFLRWLIFSFMFRVKLSTVFLNFAQVFVPFLITMVSPMVFSLFMVLSISRSRSTSLFFKFSIRRASRRLGKLWSAETMCKDLRI